MDLCEAVSVPLRVVLCGAGFIFQIATFMLRRLSIHPFPAPARPPLTAHTCASCVFFVKKPQQQLSQSCVVSRSFAAQDVLVPWHLADHHNQSQNQHRRSGGNSSTSSRDNDATNTSVVGGRGVDGDVGAFATLNDELPAEQLGTGEDGQSTGEGLGQGKSHEDGAATNRDGRAEREHNEVSAPSPTAPRHGVRVDGPAGSAGSVVYQRYCHVYAEGELEGLVERVDGLRLVESYYDRSNWCVVAEREV